HSIADPCYPSPCDANASCTPLSTTGDAPTCTCNIGYTGDGVDCNLEAPTLSTILVAVPCPSLCWSSLNHPCCYPCDPKPCDSNASCSPPTIIGDAPTCTCKTGYTGDGISCDSEGGFYCRVVQSSTKNPCDPSPCNRNASCTAPAIVGDDATCTCNTGYTGDGVACDEEGG
ncbi:unnamed protein product, partial [Hapterophycus canaliculatus]